MSLAGISWMEQYLQEFGLTIEHMNCFSCHQLFTFGPSRRYISKSLVEFPILITRLDGWEDVLTIQTYLVHAEIPFLCGKRTLEDWSFQIDRRDKILEITSKTDWSRLQVKRIDTKGGHYIPLGDLAEEECSLPRRCSRWWTWCPFPGRHKGRALFLQDCETCVWS